MHQDAHQNMFLESRICASLHVSGNHFCVSGCAPECLFRKQGLCISMCLNISMLRASGCAPSHVSGSCSLCFRKCTRTCFWEAFPVFQEVHQVSSFRKPFPVVQDEHLDVFQERRMCASCVLGNSSLSFRMCASPVFLEIAFVSQEERVCGPVLCFRKAGRLHQNVAEESIPCTSGHAPGSVSGDHSCVSGCISRQPNVYSWMCTRTCLRKAAPAPFAGRMMRPVRSRERHAGRLMFMRC